MGDRSEDGPGLTIRPGTAADAAFVVALGAEAFAHFGSYAPVMKGFLMSPDVVSRIAWRARERVGFALLDTPTGHPAFADLVAIAVHDRHRRSGVGRALVGDVIALREARGRPSLLVLTVAEDNHSAIALFRTFGFEMIPGSPGRYTGGQTSRRMARTV